MSNRPVGRLATYAERAGIISPDPMERTYDHQHIMEGPDDCTCYVHQMLRNHAEHSLPPYAGEPGDILFEGAPRKPYLTRGFWLYIALVATGCAAWVLWLSKGVWW